MSKKNYMTNINIQIFLITNFLLNIFSGYFFYSTDEYDINWTLPQCILVLRLIGKLALLLKIILYIVLIVGITYDCYDGQQPADTLSKESQKLALKEVPSLVEIFGHCFFPAAFIVGPQFPMKRYQEFVTGKYSKKVSS